MGRASGENYETGQRRRPLLVSDLIAEYFGTLYGGHGTPVELLTVCRRLVASPGTDAQRAGEPLQVFAIPVEDTQQTIELRVVGVESGDTHLGWRFRNRTINQEDFTGYVAIAAAALTVCLNGPENASAEQIAALRELGRLSAEDRSQRDSGAVASA